MANRFYTVFIVPERSAPVRRFKMSHQVLMKTALGVLLAGTVLSFMGVHYAFAVGQAAHHTTLQHENVVLKSRLQAIEDEMARIDQTLQRIETFSSRLRAITQLHDPDRNLTMGPLSRASYGRTPKVLYAQGERITSEDEAIDSKLALRLMDTNLDSLVGESLRQEDKIRQLHDHLTQEEGLLTTTPSIRPTRSRLLISPFGLRTDPYTDQEVMHKGVDFAAEPGSDVIAPADGVIIFVGNRGNGYGQSMVIDHGYGIQTHYGHLEEATAQVDTWISRGDVIAKVGNTGRLTGAHVHYEVRFNGIPQDPERFILDE